MLGADLITVARRKASNHILTTAIGQRCGRSGPCCAIAELTIAKLFNGTVVVSIIAFP